MKKLVNAITVLALAGSFAFAQEYKATSLLSPVGSISFGAWGRSTFEIGQEKQNSKVTVNPTALGNAALTAGLPMIDAYTGTKTIEDDGAEAFLTDVATEYVTAQATAATTAAIMAGEITPDQAEAYGHQVAVKIMAEQGENISNALQATALISELQKLEGDTDEKKNFARLNPDWSYGCRVGFWIIGRTNNEHFGFDFNLDADARALFVHKLYDADESGDNVNYNEDGKYAVAIGDQAKIWALLDADAIKTQFKVAFGKMRENQLRGSIGDFGQRESSDVKSEDDIFQEFWPTTGLFVSATGQKDTVLEGLYLAGCIDIAPKLGISNGDGDRNSSDELSLGEVMQLGQYGIGYTIPGIAQIKAQYWGDSIKENNYRYETSKYQAARAAGFGGDDYLGRMEFGIDFLGFMGGANGLSDVDLDKTPNANLIELGFKIPVVKDNDLRAYDPEKFYNWYSCLGTMGVIQKGFIFYKGHIWGGQGVSNLGQYTDVSGAGTGLLTMDKGDEANIIMAGFDALVEICMNPFGKQDVFLGLSGNWNITSANADGKVSAMGQSLEVKDLALNQYKYGAEIYAKKTFGANNYLFSGVSLRGQKSTMDGTVNSVADLSYSADSLMVYVPVGIEMFF